MMYASAKQALRDGLSETAYCRFESIAALCRKIAQQEGYDPDRAELAGLLCGIAEEYAEQELFSCADSYGVSVTQYERKHPNLLCGKVGAALLEHEHGVADAELLKAVRYRDGRPGMGTLEKILFLARHLEEARSFGLSDEKIWRAPTLNRKLLLMLHTVLDGYEEKQRQPEQILIDTYDFLMYENLQKGKKSADEATEVGLSDSQLDAVLWQYRSHALKIRSVANIRTLGGYKTTDGRRIKRKLIRSGRLSNISDADIQALQSFGITHAVDLRSDAERAANPVPPLGTITYLTHPLPDLTLSDYAQWVTEYFFAAENSEEKAWYLSRFFEEQDMRTYYLSLINAPEFSCHMRELFELLLCDSCQGLQFFCTSGKDRTGLTAMLLMYCLGVDMETVKIDYLTSALQGYCQTEMFVTEISSSNYSMNAAAQAQMYTGVSEAMFDAVVAELEGRYGSIDAYLAREVRLDAQQLAQLREKYLES